VPAQHQQALLDSLDAAGSVVEGIEQAGAHTVVVAQVGRDYRVARLAGCWGVSSRVLGQAGHSTVGALIPVVP
jgi:hypothetical protein